MVKKRIQGHLVETRTLVNKGASSDTFAKHFASYFGKYDEKGKKDK